MAKSVEFWGASSSSSKTIRSMGTLFKPDLLFMPLKDATANNAVLEGIACGLPVLTTDLVSTREYLDHTDAMFVKNNEVDAFRTHILELARDRDKCARYGESSRRRALDLSWPNVAKQYEKLYSMLMKKRG